MEAIKNLISRFRRIGVLFLIGLLLILYIAFGFVYWQQGGEQREVAEQIANYSAVLAKPLPSTEKLQAEYDNVTDSLAPMSDNVAITMLVGIAEKSGIDISESAGEFSVPSVSSSQTNVGGGTYRLLSFNGIYVKGDYDSVMAFISDLDSGKTLETMVLTRLNISQTEATVSDEEKARVAELQQVTEAVLDMMSAAGLLRIPNPMSFADGAATNLMGDDPETEPTVEGFPDIFTTAAERGYTGTGSPRDGYVLYEHDEISTDNTSQFKAVSYINKLTTKYYYICEADGTVRQFDGAAVGRATEYWSSGESKIKLRVSVDVDIYTKR